MATGREIRLKLRIDDDGLPLAIAGVTKQITSAFDAAASKAVAGFSTASDNIIAAIRRIERTPIVKTAPAQSALAALAALAGQLQEIERRAAAIRTPSVATTTGPHAPAALQPNTPPIPTPAAALPPRLPASVAIAQMTSRVTTQNARAGQVVGGVLQAVPTSTSASVGRLATLYGALQTAAGGAGKAIGLIPPAVGRVSLLFAGLGGAVTVLRTLGAAINASLIQPVEDLGDRFITATENSRKFELAIGGITGMSRARELNRALVSASRNQPVDVAALRETGTTFGALPALASKLNDPDAVSQIIGLNRTTARLATLDPEQGQRGATVAIRELLEGGGGTDGFVSLRRRFGLSAATLSRSIGETVENIKADPALALKAVEKITSTLIPVAS